MRRNRVCGVLFAMAVLGAAGSAHAGVQVVNCTMTPGALATEFNVTHLGGLAGTDYQIIGTCTGNFTITHDDITIEPNTGTPEIDAQVRVVGANRLTLKNIVINGVSLPSGTRVVDIFGPAYVLIDGCTIENAPSDGVAVEGLSKLVINNSLSQNNGNDGVFVQGSSVVYFFGTPRITNNGGIGLELEGATGFVNGSLEVDHNKTAGVLAWRNSFLSLQSANVHDNSPFFAVDAENTSTVNIVSSTISMPSGASGSAAVLAPRTANINIINSTISGPSANHTVLASQGSTVFIQSSTITAALPFSVASPFAILTAEQSSTIRLAGGNAITNNAAGGVAVLVSEGSTFVENNGTPDGFTAAADTINGGGRVNGQSVIELGAAAGGGGVDWNGNIAVGQLSSFRADGDNVTVSGTLTLDTAANAYFNHTKGTTIDISSVVCNSATDHVARPTLVTPNVPIGAPPGCALF